jgi:hypothetical protein
LSWHWYSWECAAEKDFHLGLMPGSKCRG